MSYIIVNRSWTINIEEIVENAIRKRVHAWDLWVFQREVEGWSVNSINIAEVASKAVAVVIYVFGKRQSMGGIFDVETTCHIHERLDL